MRRSDRRHALFHRPHDTWDKGDSDPVTELDMVKAELRHLLQHRIAILVSVRTPTRGKGEDGFHKTKDDSGRAAQTLNSNKKPRPTVVEARPEKSIAIQANTLFGVP